MVAELAHQQLYLVSGSFSNHFFSSSLFRFYMLELLPCYSFSPSNPVWLVDRGN